MINGRCILIYIIRLLQYSIQSYNFFLAIQECLSDIYEEICLWELNAGSAADSGGGSVKWNSLVLSN